MPFHFTAYDAKCATLTPLELQKEWEKYTRQITTGGTSTGISILAAPITMGISLVGLGVSAPKIHNARKKRTIIESHLQSYGTTHHTRKRDVIGSVALSSTTGVLTVGMAPAGGEAIAAAAEVGLHSAEAIAHVALDGAMTVVEELHGKDKERRVRKQVTRDQKLMALAGKKKWAVGEKVETSEENSKVEDAANLSPSYYAKDGDLAAIDEKVENSVFDTQASIKNAPTPVIISAITSTPITLSTVAATNDIVDSLNETDGYEKTQEQSQVQVVAPTALQAQVSISIEQLMALLQASKLGVDISAETLLSALEKSRQAENRNGH